MPRKAGHQLVDEYKKADGEYPFEHGEVINYTLDGRINTSSHYKNAAVLPNSVAVEEGNCSGNSP